MIACKTLVRTSLCCVEFRIRIHTRRASSSLSLSSHCRSFSSPISPRNLSFSPLLSPNPGFRHRQRRFPSRCYACVEETADAEDELLAEESNGANVRELLSDRDDVSRLMKMERRTEAESGGRWFPYLDRFRSGNTYLSSGEVLEAIDPYIMEVRKERFRDVVKNRSYSVCLVVEGLCDFGNVSAAFRSADALGFQSVHVVSSDGSKRYRDNRHVSMGAEKWLDIELWSSAKECFNVLKSRGYRIATTHVGIDAVSVYDMDWSCPTAIVVGNENRGISNEALELSDLHCSIPMKGMVDSFNVSVAAGILMHHAVCDRTRRLGGHGDLSSQESQILLAEFFLRHSNSAISIAHEYAKRTKPVPKL